MLKNNGNVPSNEGTSNKISVAKSAASDNESVEKQELDEEMHSPNLDLDGTEPQNDPGYDFTKKNF